MPTPGFYRAVLMCHAPVVVPEIGQEQAVRCRETTRGMQSVARSLVADDPCGIVVLSPHTPRYRSAYGVVEGPEVFGDFEPFGHAAVKGVFESDRNAQVKLLTLAQRFGISLQHVPSGPLDHGALVPLYFLSQEGFRGRVVIIGFPYQTSTKANCIAGKMLSEFASNSQERWSLLASGDMSHRLVPGAPAGYHPDAMEFDKQVVDCVGTGRYEEISAIDPGLRSAAAEDVVDSLEIATTAIGTDRKGRRLVSYEGPFGVGYLTAILKGPEA